MADKPKKKATGVEVLDYQVEKVDGMTEEKALAKAALDPSVKATILTRSFVMGVAEENLHSTELLTELMVMGRKAREGDLGGIEEMLAAQAYSLDAMFCNLAIRAKSNMGTYPKAAELYMKMALRAQSQCRATAETLAAMKNPLPYIKQANIGAAVQVNNGQAMNFETSAAAPARAQEISPGRNELLTGDQHEALDYRRTSATGRAHPHLAALEKGDRSTD